MKTIGESNKLIAEFMGRCGKVSKHLYWVNIPSVKWVTVEQMQFHTSWDWLMPVVERIANVKGFHNIKADLLDLKITANISDVYSAVISFIEWYNNK